MINLCGYGETLIPKEMPDIIYELLKQGHFVNVTNNGTQTERFRQIVAKCPPEFLRRLSFSFSLHYIELKNRNMLDIFANNIHYVKDNGCSILVQINLVDDYIERKDEIKEFCREAFGAYPQVALTRRETDNGYEILTERSAEEYAMAAAEFGSPLFDFTYRNFNVKRKEFCYAGDWSFKVMLGSGDLKSCNDEPPHQNLYRNLKSKIKPRPVGNFCKSGYCVNSSHYLSLGCIPAVHTPAYCALRDRPQAAWYQPEMRLFLSGKFNQSNAEYNAMKKLGVNLRRFCQGILQRVKRLLAKPVKSVLRKIKQINGE